MAHLPAGQSLVVQDLLVESGAEDPASLVRVRDCAGAVRASTSTSAVAEGETLTLFFAGVPGDLAALLVGAELMPAVSLGIGGKLLHRPPPFVLLDG